MQKTGGQAGKEELCSGGGREISKSGSEMALWEAGTIAAFSNCNK
jgi:hypothetical protein